MNPVPVKKLTEKSIRLCDIEVGGTTLYWSEIRPEEGGRGVLRNEECNSLIPQEASVRSRVHDYGGKAFSVRGSSILFSNDGPLVLDGNTLPTPHGYIFGDLLLLDDQIIAVAEKGEDNLLVSISFSGKVTPLHTGRDFYSSPTLSPDKKTLAFLSWSHPNMPWEQTELMLLDIEAKKATSIRNDSSIFQPSFGPDGELYYACDASGFWNIYSHSKGNLCPREADFGEAQWLLGQSRYVHTPDGIACIYTEKGTDYLALLADELKTISLLFTSYRNIQAATSSLYFIAGSASEPEALYSYDYKQDVLTKIQASAVVDLPDISLPEQLEFKSNGRTTYGNYYPQSGQRQGVIIRAHSGPTTHAKPLFDMRVQFLTSRGFAVFDVNYGGSTGFGKAYRKRLTRSWGIVDVEDCIAAATTLINMGYADKGKLFIKGSSAGGYTTLVAMTKTDLFAGGICYYGIGDLIALTGESPKFESHYFDHLVAPYPEGKAIYKERSPLLCANKITKPLLFLHGDNDSVVPISQAENMSKSTSSWTKLVCLEGEGHGFRKSSSIEKAAEEELAFIQKVLL